MIIRPTDVCEDVDAAKYGVVKAAQALGIEFSCNLTTQWLIKIDGNEREAFLELAREEAKTLKK